MDRRFLRKAAPAALALIAIAVSAAPAAAALPTPVACSTCWHPALQSRWQYQLQGVAAYASTGGINTTISAAPQGGGTAVSPTVWDIDLYVDQAVAGNNTTLDIAAVNAIHALHGHVICYVDAGTWENWRADAGQFPASVLGNKNGWPGEKYLDIRQMSVLGPIMTARVQKCKQAGFDGVEFDNVDTYTAKTGFPLTATDQLNYNTYLGNLAHSNGLSAGLKNDLAEAVLRLRHQRAVHAVQGVRPPRPGAARLGLVRQGRVRGRVQGLHAQLHQVERLELQHHPEGPEPVRHALDAVPLRRC
jgi:hypothetical protein